MAGPKLFSELKFDANDGQYVVRAIHRGHTITLQLLADNDVTLQQLLPLVQQFWKARASHFKAFREYCAVHLLQELNDTNDCGQDNFKPATAAQVRKLLPVPFAISFGFNDPPRDFYFEMSGGDETEVLGECVFSVFGTLDNGIESGAVEEMT